VKRLCRAIYLVAVATGRETISVKRIFIFLALLPMGRCDCHATSPACLSIYYYGGREDNFESMKQLTSGSSENGQECPPA
jgi:hypothetical protein